MSIGTNPPYGWGYVEPDECDAKVVSVGALTAFEVGDIVTLGTQASAGTPTYKMGGEAYILATCQSVGAFEDTKGFFGVVIGMNGSDGTVGSILKLKLKGLVKAFVGVSGDAGATIATGDPLGVGNGVSYADANATSGVHCVGMLAQADVVIGAGAADGTKTLASIFFDGTRLPSAMP